MSNTDIKMINMEPPSATGTASGAVSPVYAKWGEASIAGFQPIPDLLLKNQSKLDLTPTDIVVLLNILMHWWYPEQKPFPRSTTIAHRMGMTARTVQRSLNHIEKEGLLSRFTGDGGKTYVDPTPLVEKLNEIALTDTDYLVRKGLTDAA